MSEKRCRGNAINRMAYLMQMYGFQVTDDMGKSKKLWCHSQQACQEWCSFLSHWANTEVLLTHWYHVQWSKVLGRYRVYGLGFKY